MTNTSDLCPLRRKLAHYENEYGFKMLQQRTDIEQRTLRHILYNTRGKYNHVTLDILYEFFHLDKDEWYQENRRKWIKPTESILGAIFRAKRMEKGWTPEQVAKMIKMSDRAIKRIEAGETLP